MKKLIEENSKILLGITGFEGIIGIIAILSFVYTDSLKYNESAIFNAGIEKLLETMYSSTWWALILLLIALTVIMSLTSLIYKKMEFQFISICNIFVLLILSINIKNSLLDNLVNAAVIGPIIILNILGYKNQKEIINKK